MRTRRTKHSSRAGWAAVAALICVPAGACTIELPDSLLSAGFPSLLTDTGFPVPPDAESTTGGEPPDPVPTTGVEPPDPVPTTGVEPTGAPSETTGDGPAATSGAPADTTAADTTAADTTAAPPDGTTSEGGSGGTTGGADTGGTDASTGDPGASGGATPPDMGGADEGGTGEVDPTGATPPDTGGEEPTTGAGPACGDGVIDPGEVCDDGVNDGSYGGCEPDCGRLGPHCGDGVVQPEHESCDVPVGLPVECAPPGATAPPLRCVPGLCRLSDEPCVGCGDGVIGPGELCDGDDLGGATCDDLGLAGGVLTCAPDCRRLDPSQCGTVTPG